MDLVSQTVGGSGANPMQIGLGGVTGSISPVFSQGAIENTREATNVAIQGNGLFVVRGPEGNAYTRAGDFTFDSNGTLVTSDGYKVQGYTGTDPATGAIVTTGQPTDITVPPGVLRAPSPTSTFQTNTNLDSGAATGATATSSVQIYDALGTPHVATITYTKTATPGSWTYAVTVPGEEITGGTAGTPFSIGSGTATFTAQGALSAFTAAAPATGGGTPPADVTFTTPTWVNGAAASSLTWDVVDANNVASITGFSSPSATSSIIQNGSAAGMVDDISISSDGTIVATFGEGQTVAIGRLALASFNNPKRRVKVGWSRYGERQAVGIPNGGVPGTGGRGTLIGSALEQSNVDIAQEFTQMILAQRGYQANSKTITVSDELLVDTLNLKR
jgi:flagellar hook protein FlgE